MPKAKEITPVASMPAPGVPDWVTETPDETEYFLAMLSEDGGLFRQEIQLTRDEFIGLKEHLAKMRGLVPAQQTDAA